MAHTTQDLDPHVLEGLKRLQAHGKKPIANRAAQPFRWHSGDLEARVDLADKEAIYEKLDRESDLSS